MSSEILEHMLFGRTGSLVPHDIVYRQEDVAHCLERPDGSILFRLKTEPSLVEANLVWNDGQARVTPLEAWGETGRYRYWQVAVRPAGQALRYSFAFRNQAGQPVYLAAPGQMHAVETPFHLRLGRPASADPPEWAQGAVIYQIFPERFANGDPTNDPPGADAWGAPPTRDGFQGGDLAGIQGRLDYLAGLGVDLLYLNPIFASPSNHKFDCTDFTAVDPAFGGNEALRALVAAVHERGMRIVLDASFNHCHPGFFAFRDVAEKGPASSYWDWFTIREWPLRVRYRPHRVPAHYRRPPAEREAWLAAFAEATGILVERADDDGPPFEATYEAWYNVLTMPRLNQENPATRAYFLDLTAHWLEGFDVDGWRMDVAQHVPASFWRDFRQAARAARADAYLLAEIWGDTRRWLQGDMFDATMNYTFHGLCLDYFAAESMDTATFVAGLHELLMMYAPPVTLANQNLLSSHDLPRFRRHADEREERWRLATLFQMTFPGAPGLYYGDEVGLTGGDEPDCRRAFPWHEPERWERGALDLVRELGALRRRVPALRRGDWRLVWSGPEALAFTRRHGDERILVTLARREPIVEARLDLGDVQPARLWGQGEVERRGRELMLREVPAYGGLIVAL